MLFNSFEFIFLFLPVTLLLYFVCHRLGWTIAAKIILISASLYFYAFFNLSYLPIISVSIIFNFGIGHFLSHPSQYPCPLKRKFILWSGIIFNLGLLGYFKYTDFMIENVNFILGTDFSLLNILLPLGISFFTFQQLAFIVDSYSGNGKIPSFIDYCNFVTFFPQLIAGPIVLPEEMLPQFENKANYKPIAKNIFDGIFIFVIGLIKKVLIADSISVFANAGFSLDLEHYTCAEAWLISLSYTFQLYFDFSGYCDMAIGIGKMFNINLPLNFNVPYRATNFRDFWKRWHITLNRFFTQYLYIPLGGNRCKEKRVLFNLFLVFFFSGLWHGSGWTFIIWGCCHGLGVIICRIWKRKGFSMPNWAGMFITFFFINILWVLFRADNMHEAWVIIRSMFDNFNLTLSPEYTSNLPSILPNKINMLLLAIAMALSVAGPTGYKLMIDYDWPRAKQACIVVGMAISVLFLSRIVTFLYFNF